MTLDEIVAVYKGSSGDATKALYAKLEAVGPMGLIAVNLFRACKTSERAKKYRRGPGHISASYERKDWSVENATRILAGMNPPPFRWGWGIDEVMKRSRPPRRPGLSREVGPRGRRRVEPRLRVDVGGPQRSRFASAPAARGGGRR